MYTLLSSTPPPFFSPFPTMIGACVQSSRVDRELERYRETSRGKSAKMIGVCIWARAWDGSQDY